MLTPVPEASLLDKARERRAEGADAPYLAGFYDAPVKREWSARLDLEYELRGTETVNTRRTHVGPLRVQRPFHESSGVCQTYVIHPPGGVVGGDVLDVNVRVHAGARALLTTPGATKFYRSVNEIAVQRQHLSVAAGASIEWFPQETILFDGALAKLQTHVQLEESSKCAFWEVTCLGRPAGNQPFTSGCVNQRLDVYTQRRPLLLESLLLESLLLKSQHLESRHLESDDGAGIAALNAPWGFQGLPVYGTMLLHPLPKELLAVAREAVSELWSPRSDHRFGASQLPYSEQQSTIVCRYLGTSAEHCKLLFIRVWRALRPHLLGIEAEPPRVWHT